MVLGLSKDPAVAPLLKDLSYDSLCLFHIRHPFVEVIQNDYIAFALGTSLEYALILELVILERVPFEKTVVHSNGDAA